MTVYNGTITVGNYSGVVYGYARDGNAAGLPAFGSVSFDLGAPTLDALYWPADESGLAIIFPGEVAGTVTFDGQEYALSYDSEQDISGYGGANLGGPYPTSGTVNFTYDDAGTAGTYTVAMEVRDVGIEAQAVTFPSDYILPLATRDLDLAPQDVPLVDAATLTIAMETHDITLASEEVALAAGFEIFMQGNYTAPLFQELTLSSTTNDIILETYNVNILVYADGMGLDYVGGITLDTADATISYPEIELTYTQPASGRARSFAVIFA